MFFVDNDSEKQEKIWKSKKIHSPKYLTGNDKDYKIIVTPSNSTYNDISEQLLGMGFKEENFCSFEEFLLIWKWKFERKIVAPQIDFMINTVCSLKCEHCLYHMPFSKVHVQRELEELKKDVDSFFTTFDYCIKVRICGGEPLLYKQLPELVEYIYKFYGDKFKIFEIITNGTILPSEELLKIMKEYQGKFYVSDYTLILKDRVKTDEIEQILKEREVPYLRQIGFNVEGGKIKYTWFDMGSPFEKQKKN